MVPWPEHVTEMSQPCTAISMAPVMVTRLVVSSPSPTTTRRSRLPATAQAHSSVPAPSLRPGTRSWSRTAALATPGLTIPVPRASASASRESVRWPSRVRRSHPAQGVGRDMESGVASRAADSA